VAHCLGLFQPPPRVSRGARIAVAVVSLAGLGVTFLALALADSDDLPRRRLWVGDSPVVVEVATRPADLRRGLSGRDGLARGRGMLFVHDHEGTHGYWMKGMQFPLDIIWIGQDGRVVDIAATVSPDSYPRMFQPRDPARYVLEVNAGWAARHAVRREDRVRGLPRPESG
jgi:uncharacterized membrane protein (UPF0127 family)